MNEIVIELKTLNDGRRREKISKRYRKSNLKQQIKSNFILFFFLFIDIIVI